jgi:hypothetical protein
MRNTLVAGRRRAAEHASFAPQNQYGKFDIRGLFDYIAPQSRLLLGFSTLRSRTGVGGLVSCWESRLRPSPPGGIARLVCDVRSIGGRFFAHTRLAEERGDLMKARVVVCLLVCVVAGLAATCWADEGPPDPISLDRQSPSVVGGALGIYMPGATPGNIYDMLLTGPMPPAPPLGYDAGGPGPIVHVQEGAYSLLPMQDNLDGLSNGEMDPHMPLSIYFSGDDMSQGMGNTDYNHQATRMQAAGDRFVVNGLSMVSPVAVMAGGGPSWIGAPQYPGGLGNWPINLLSANQHRYNEIPSIGPAATNTYVPPFPGATVMDDMDALELTPIDTNGDKIHDMPIYFSLDAASPSLGGVFWPSDILMSPAGPSGFWRYAGPGRMGLSTTDEIDALAVWNVSGGQSAMTGTDYALFSLAPGSPYLAGPDGLPGSPDDWSAADIFVTNFTGMNLLYLQYSMLGMLFDDNIDALDVEYAPGGMIQEPLDWVSNAWVPNNGDYNGDGVTDAADYTIWRDNRGNVGLPGIPGDGDDGSLTGNPDGIVDEFDFQYWKVSFNSVGYGAGALAGAVPEPASVTLAAMAMVAFIAVARARRK